MFANNYQATAPLQIFLLQAKNLKFFHHSVYLIFSPLLATLWFVVVKRKLRLQSGLQMWLDQG